MFTQLVLVPNHENCNFLETNLFNNMLSLILCKLMYFSLLIRTFTMFMFSIFIMCSSQGRPHRMPVVTLYWCKFRCDIKARKNLP